MAGDWIPVRIGLHQTREVIAVAEATGRSSFEVSGLFVALWGWFSLESRDGHAASVTRASLTRAVGADDTFWNAVERVGWLQETDTGIMIPNWANWNGRSAKKRLQTAQRQARQRDREAQRRTEPQDDSSSRHAPVTQQSRTERDASVTTEQDSTSKEKERAPSPPPSFQFSKKEEIATWNSLAKKYDLPEIQDLTDDRRRKLRACLQEHPDFWAQVEEKLATRNEWTRQKRMPKFDQLMSPSFRQKLLEGNYAREKAPDEPDPQEQAERRRLVAALKKRVGQTAVDARGREYTVEEIGMQSLNGHRPWGAHPVAELQKLVDGKLVKWRNDNAISMR